MMYDELVKRLRTMADWVGISFLEESVNVRTNLSEAADAIESTNKAYQMMAEAYESEVTKPRWIPVTERLPKEMDRSCGEWSAQIRPSDDVLVWLSSEKRQNVAWYSYTYNKWINVDENTWYCFGEVTHWMPLPEPQKEET